MWKRERTISVFSLKCVPCPLAGMPEAGCTIAVSVCVCVRARVRVCVRVCASCLCAQVFNSSCTTDSYQRGSWSCIPEEVQCRCRLQMHWPRPTR